MKIGDTVYVHGHVDEIRKDVVIIKNDGGYFGTVKSEIVEGTEKYEAWLKDKIYSLMKDYYFDHKNDRDDSWQGGFGECMNLIPNMMKETE